MAELVLDKQIIEEAVKATEPVGTGIHVVLDNYATHKTPAAQRLLARHPEYHLHFTPPAPAGSTRSNGSSPA